jgi:hypothetical protein
MRTRFVFPLLVYLFMGSQWAQAQALFSTGFEAPSYTLGNLSGQGGWFMYNLSNAANAQVENTTVNSGSQAVSVTAAPSTVAMPLQTVTFSASGIVDASIFMYMGNTGTAWSPLCFFYSSTNPGLCLGVSAFGFAYVNNGSTASSVLPQCLSALGTLFACTLILALTR